MRRYLDARGGIVKLRTVQSLRLTGTIPARVLRPLEPKRPGKMRTEFAVEGQKGIRAWDGRTALPCPAKHAA